MSYLDKLNSSTRKSYYGGGDCCCPPKPRCGDKYCCNKVVIIPADNIIVDSDQYVITTSGVYELCGDITWRGTKLVFPIVIASNDVVLDLKGFTIRDKRVVVNNVGGASLGAIDVGVVVNNVRKGFQNVEIRNGSIEGFAAVGIQFNDLNAKGYVHNIKSDDIGGTHATDNDFVLMPYDGLTVGFKQRAHIAITGITYNGASSVIGAPIVQPADVSSAVFNTHDFLIEDNHLTNLSAPNFDFYAASISMSGLGYVEVRRNYVAHVFAGDRSRGIHNNVGNNVVYEDNRTFDVSAGNGLAGLGVTNCYSVIMRNNFSMKNTLVPVQVPDNANPLPVGTVVAKNGLRYLANEFRIGSGISAAFSDRVIFDENKTQANVANDQGLTVSVVGGSRSLFSRKQITGLLLFGNNNVVVESHTDNGTNNLNFDPNTTGPIVTRVRPGASVFSIPFSVDTTAPNSIPSRAPYRADLYNIKSMHSDVGVWVDAGFINTTATPVGFQMNTVIHNTSISFTRYPGLFGNVGLLMSYAFNFISSGNKVQQKKSDLITDVYNYSTVSPPPTTTPPP